MALEILAPPPVEPVTLAELKEYLRVDPSDTSQDGTITELATAARGWAEVYVKRSFVVSSWRLLLDFFPGYIDLKLAGAKVSSPFVSGSNAVLVGIRYALVLPFPPINSIVVFQYQNANGEVTPMIPESDYFLDLASNPARLTPPFGAMWPVARVVVNAIQIDFALGYALPVVLSSVVLSPPNPFQVLAATYQFQTTDVGRPISIPGAAVNGGTLNTIVAGISSPPSGTAFLRDPWTTTFEDETALLVNSPAGQPRHWSMIKSGIKMLTAFWYEKRIPDEKSIPRRVKDVLSPVRDLRF